MKENIFLWPGESTGQCVQRVYKKIKAAPALSARSDFVDI